MSGGLRIAHVQPMTLALFGHEDAGVGREVRYSVSNLAAAQSRIGQRPHVHLLASSQPGEREVDGVRYTFHPWFGRDAFARQLSRRMLRAVDPGGADAVHFHGARQFHLMFAAVATAASRRGLPLFAQDRGSRPTGRLETIAQRYALRRSAAVLASSAASAGVLRELGAAPEAIHVIPNGVDPDTFAPDPDRKPPAAGRPFELLSVARLAPEKDPLTFADAAVLLARSGVELRVTVVSRGPLKDEVVRRLDAGGVPAQYVDHLPQDRLAERYRTADALAITSPGEGWSQVVVEAMACGLPIVATDVVGVSDAVGDAALKVPPRDPESIARELARLAGDPELWAARREAGLRRASEFTWEAVAQRVDRVYRTPDAGAAPARVAMPEGAVR
jgi:glycosyltransferase involved in cell wall biosynthesis